VTNIGMGLFASSTTSDFFDSLTLPSLATKLPTGPFSRWLSQATKLDLLVLTS
jgi:hypothetical protein